MINKTLLEVTGLSKHFGGIRALNAVSLTLEKGSMVSMIGPNGAGKPTFVNVITGLHCPDEGYAHFEGQDVAGLQPHAIAALGIGRTFQLEELFSSMTVLENAMVGCHTRSHRGMFATGFSLRQARREEEVIREEALQNLDLVGLRDKAFSPIKKLPLGERKLVGIARALGMKPKLLMLDEPAGGLAAHEIDELVRLIYGLAEKKI